MRTVVDGDELAVINFVWQKLGGDVIGQNSVSVTVNFRVGS